MKEILITSSVLIVLVLLLRLILRGKVRQKLLYGAWLLVALRLLVPIQFGQWSFSMNTLTETVTQQSETIQQAEQILRSPVVTNPFYEVRYEDLKQEYQAQGLDPETPEVQIQIEKQLPKPAPTLSQILKAVWLAGMGLMALWFLLTNFVFQRKAKAGAVPLETDTSVPVRVSTGVPTPCLVGLVRPVIYVTPECTADPQMLRHVLTHEIAHLRQWDPVWSFVRCVCLCIYWFNPLVWVAAAQSRRDCELSCDESALRQLGDEERTAYGRTLLTMVRSASAATLLNTATSMSESKKQLKERMCFIVKKPRNIVIAAIAMTLVIALAAGCAFTGGKQSEETPPKTEPTTTEPTTEPTTAPTKPDTTYIPEPHSLLSPVSPVVQPEAPTEAQLIAKEVITGPYLMYMEYGVCCNLGPDVGYVDMSQYLTDAQKEDYYDYQIPITCCRNAQEVQEHIDRYVGKDAQSRAQYGYPEDKLFTDDEGNLYIIVIPSEYDLLRHFEVISQTKKQIVVRACRRDEDECWRNDIYTLKSTENGYQVTEVKEDPDYRCEIVTLYEDPNYQLFKYGNTGYGGFITNDSGHASVYFMEDFYCPAVTRLSEHIWEISTNYGDGYVKRVYWDQDNANHHKTYDFAIALGHRKIAFLDGEPENRTLVICDLFDRTTAQTFTELGFKAENMPVTAAAFSENDTQLTLTYYTDQNTETSVTLELIP